MRRNPRPATAVPVGTPRDSHDMYASTVPRQRLAVHGPLEAVVDPILEILDSGAAAGILGEEPPDARPWGGPGLPSAVEVATRAVHAGADVRLGVHGRVGQDSFPLADRLTERTVGDRRLARWPERRHRRRFRTLGTPRLAMNALWRRRQQAGD